MKFPSPEGPAKPPQKTVSGADNGACCPEPPHIAHLPSMQTFLQRIRRIINNAEALMP